MDSLPIQAGQYVLGPIGDTPFSQPRHALPQAMPLKLGKTRDRTQQLAWVANRLKPRLQTSHSKILYQG